jgi:hypothetical protein
MAAAIMLAGSVAIAQRITYPDLPEPALEGTLTNVPVPQPTSRTTPAPSSSAIAR